MAASSVTRGIEKKNWTDGTISSGGNQVISKIFYIKHLSYLIMAAIWNVPRLPTSGSLIDVHCYRCTRPCRLWQSIYLFSCLILLVPKFWTCKKLLSKLLQTGATLHFVCDLACFFCPLGPSHPIFHILKFISCPLTFFHQRCSMPCILSLLLLVFSLQDG